MIHAELVRVYGFAASKALATRSLLTHLEKHKVNNKALMFRSVKQYCRSMTDYDRI